MKIIYEDHKIYSSVEYQGLRYQRVYDSHGEGSLRWMNLLSGLKVDKPRSMQLEQEYQKVLKREEIDEYENTPGRLRNL